LAPFLIWTPYRDTVAVHALPDARRNSPKKIAKFQIRDQGVRHVQEQLETLAFAPQIASGRHDLLG
jgi:hypothetical protein